MQRGHGGDFLPLVRGIAKQVTPIIEGDCQGGPVLLPGGYQVGYFGRIEGLDGRTPPVFEVQVVTVDLEPAGTAADEMEAATRRGQQALDVVELKTAVGQGDVKSG